MSATRDVLVVGGGPAGLAAAIAAADAGLRTTLVERRPPPVDKACGEGLMPGAVAHLDALGVSRPAGYPFVGIRYIQGRHQAAARFRGEPGLGVRRTRLHRALWKRAEQVGVDLLQGRIEGVEQSGDTAAAGGLRARWLIAADGLRSPTTRSLGLVQPPRHPPRIGLRQHFGVAPWTDHVEVHWSAAAEAYVTPIAPDEVGVALLAFADRVPPPKGGDPRPFHRLLAGFPALVDRLAGAATTSRLAGAGPFERHLSRRVHGRVLLVGDAAGYLDPLTGEGIRLGLGAARAAVAAIVSGEVERYDAAWRDLSRPQLRATAALLALARSRLSRGRIVPVAAAVPALMQRVVDTLA